MSTYKYKNLALQAGGVLGTAYIGVVQALDEKGILSNLERVAGASAGAIMGTLLALRFTPVEIEKIMLGLDFSKFTDPTNLLAIDSLQFLTGCRIRPALASAESIVEAIDRSYGVQVATQESLDLSLEEILDPSRPIPPERSEPTVPLQAFRKLEERHENLVNLLFERGILHAKDLDDLV